MYCAMYGIAASPAARLGAPLPGQGQLAVARTGGGGGRPAGSGRAGGSRDGSVRVI